MKAILHCDSKWGIGKRNDLMFRLPKDMKFFRRTTSGKVVVMGSNTLLSFPGGMPLKNRTNIVLWPDGDLARARRDGFILVRSMEELLDQVGRYNPDDVFVIGGAMMYHTMLPYCSEVLLTKVDADGGAEVFFDNLDALPNWKLVSESSPEDDNGLTIRFTTYRNSSVRPLSDLEEVRVSSTQVYDGPLLKVFNDKVTLPDGKPAGRDLIRHIGAVCVVAVTDDGRILLERQYRYPVAQVVTEIPAGKLDSRDEDRLEAAKRELREETGYTASSWTFIGDYLPTPAYSDERISMYLAQGLSSEAGQDLDEDEFLEFKAVPLSDVLDAIDDGRITDGKTQAAVLKAARLLGK